jgi:hypothetical protein
MHPVGFEPTISAGERPQTYALDRAATGTGNIRIYMYVYIYSVQEGEQVNTSTRNCLYLAITSLDK